MIRLADATDLPEIEAVLSASFESTMFFRSNLYNYGLGGNASHGMDVFVDKDRGVEAGLFGITNSGNMLACFDAEDIELASQFASALNGRTLKAMTGENGQVRATFDALGVTSKDLRFDNIQPLYSLKLVSLKCFEEVVLRPPNSNDLDLLAHWRVSSAIETLGAQDNADTRADASAQITRTISEDAMRILEVKGERVAMTAFNARLPDCVQIGGVYVPKEHRNRGFARRAVSQHLLEARAEGVEKAILFAANPAASRAYEAIGFERRGTYRVAIFADPSEVNL